MTEAIVELLKKIEFGCPQGRCPYCLGWDTQANESRPRVHTLDCKLAAALSIPILPTAPAPAKVTVWTCTTEGDNCPLTTTVHATEAEAQERVRDDLRADCKPSKLEHLNAMPAADLPGAWQDKNDGACIIESHEFATTGALAPSEAAAYQAKAWAVTAETHRDAMRANQTIVCNTPDELKARVADKIVSALEWYASITPASV